MNRNNAALADRVMSLKHPAGTSKDSDICDYSKDSDILTL